MKMRMGIGQLTLILEEIVQAHMENGARLMLVPDKGAADALDIERQRYQNVLDLIHGKKTKEEIIAEAGTALTEHVPPLPQSEA